MPGNPNIMATKTIAGDVLVFDYTRHPSIPKDDTCNPQIRLKGHSKEGYGLSWNPHESKKGWLASAADDQIVCTWDVNAAGDMPATLNPANIYRGHTDVVEVTIWTDA